MTSNNTGRGDSHATRTVPAALRRQWESAEGTLFSTVVAEPDLYERAVRAVQLTADLLRERCLDLESLILTWENETPAQEALRAAQLSTTEVRLDLIASAAFALRFRELAVETARHRRLAQLARAREAGDTWGVLEESGAVRDAPAQLYQRIELHVPSGAVMVATAEPDETGSRALYRLAGGRLDATTGYLRPDTIPGIPQSTYDDRGSWEAAAADVRRRLAER